MTNKKENNGVKICQTNRRLGVIFIDFLDDSINIRRCFGFWVGFFFFFFWGGGGGFCLLN